MKKIVTLVFFLLFATAPALADVSIKNASTSKIISVFVNDSSVTTGAGKTGLAFNTASLVCYYYEDGAGTGATSISLQTSTLGTYTSGCFKEIDAANMPGWYEFCPPNAALDGGAGKAVVFSCKGAANMAPMNLRVQLSPAVDVASSQADSLTAASFAADGAVQAGSGTSIQLASAETYADSELVGRQICIVAGVGKGQCREITANVGATDTTTVTPTLTTPLDTTSKYVIGGFSRFAATMNVDAYAELSAVPGATPTLAQMIQWIYQIHRFKLEQTSSTTTLRKADSSTSLSTSTVSDDGTTFNRGKFN